LYVYLNVACTGCGDVTPITVTHLLSSGGQIRTEEQEEQEQNDDVFIAFARVFSGTIKKGQELYVLGPKHEPQSAIEKVWVEHNIMSISLLPS
jgi:hypothetical protein